jgi:DNA polymerase-3 subunit beta
LKGLKGAPDTKVSKIIPARALKEVSRLASMTEQIHVAITENQAMFAAQGVTIASRLIDGAYPEYQRLLPPAFGKTFRVNRKELLASLKRVNLFCGNTNPPTPIRLSFTSSKESLMGDELLIAGSSQEIGAAQEIVGFTNEDGAEDGAGDQAFVAAFNPSYLMSAVSATGTEDVLFKFNEPLKPAMVIPADNPEDAPDLKLMIMPMRDQYAEEEKAGKNKGSKGPKAAENAAKEAPEPAENSKTPAEEEKVPVGVGAAAGTEDEE